jgi:hypothetical protein
MQSSSETNNVPKPARNWIWTVLVVLSVEKIIQHSFVTIAFILDISGIRSKVAVPPDLLMISGAVVTILFTISVWGMFAQRQWATNLLIGLALFDIIGEFIAQGRVDIKIPLSFLVAILLLIFSLVYRRQILRT